MVIVSTLLEVLFLHGSELVIFCRFGPRFPPASQCYNFKLRQLARKTGEDLGMKDFLREGVYCFLGGPSFETVTECRFLKVAGVDATGAKSHFATKS